MAWLSPTCEEQEWSMRRYLAPTSSVFAPENGIEHRPTRPYPPWTNGQAERMNRTIKEATIKVFH